MARKSISEYKAKLLLFEKLGFSYQGIAVTKDDLSSLRTLNSEHTYVVKVDQGIKKRLKQGLIHLDVSPNNLQDAIEDLETKGYSRFLIEKYQKHEQYDERYLAFERVREGIKVFLSRRGGVNIEEQQDSLQLFIVPYAWQDEIEKKDDDTKDQLISKIASLLDIEEKVIHNLLKAMDDLHISFIEINPFVVNNNKEISILDLAVEVDSAGEFFVKGAWSEKDFVGSFVGETLEEKSIASLSAKSQASFRLSVLNPEGSIFMLLSGGGASIVLADEVYNQGFGKELANYGEYSGNPNAEETYIYTKQLLSLLMKSPSRKKILIIAGGVANFTDIRITFRGIIQALDEFKDKLHEVKIYVRRGGPYQEEGLQMMKNFLEREKLQGKVFGPELMLTDIIATALKELS